ncbi:MAG: chemotaxis protein CheW [Bacteroidia bacterium]
MTQTETHTSYLTFRLGDEFFAANVGKVLEILEIPQITKVPRSPDFMRGVINLRGSVLPVIDTRTKFGLPLIDDTVNTCILVMNVTIDGQPVTIGATADSVQEVMEIEADQMQTPPAIGSKYKSEFIHGMVKINEQFIMILDLDKVFSSNEGEMFQEIINTNS